VKLKEIHVMDGWVDEVRADDERSAERANLSAGEGE